MERELRPAPTFRITTYWKRKRGEPGMTQMRSQRLSPAAALDWVLRKLPDDAREVGHPAPETVVLTVDWAKVKFRA